MSAPDTPSAAPAPRTFSPVIVLWMLIVGIVAFAGFSVMSAYAPDLRDSTDGGGHALSKSAIGFAGLRELLTIKGDTVVVGRGGARPDALTLFTPAGSVDDKALGPLRAATPKLVILPKWAPVPDFRHPGWVQKVDLQQGEEVSASLSDGFFTGDRVAGPLTVVRRAKAARPVLKVAVEPYGEGGPARAPLNPGDTLRPGAIDRLQTATGDGWTPLVVDEAGAPILLRAEKEAGLYVLTDPDLLNNQGLFDLATAQTGVALLDAIRSKQPEPIVQDVTLNGFKRARSPLRMAFEPPFLGLTLAALGTALLMGLHAACRFGPPRVAGRALALGTLALAENCAGLIRLAGREPAMAPAYAAGVRSSVARAVGAPRDLAGPRLDEMLDGIGRARGLTQTSSALTAAAGAVRTRADLMRLADDLNDWKREMTRDRR